MNILTIGNLKKSYNDFAAVNGISLAVEAGEIHGILGPNGAELKERVAKALDFVGLTDVKDKKSGEFSGGMKRRLKEALIKEALIKSGAHIA